MFVQNMAYAISKGLSIAELRKLTIVAYLMLLDSWREEDDMQRKMNARVNFAVRCASDSKQLEQYLD